MMTIQTRTRAGKRAVPRGRKPQKQRSSLGDRQVSSTAQQNGVASTSDPALPPTAVGMVTKVDRTVGGRAKRLDRELHSLIAQAHDSSEVKSPPFYTSTGVIKRGVYSLVKTYFKRKAGLRSLLDDLGDSPARLSALTDNPFHWVLVALRNRGFASPASELRRIANELEYARRHDVPVHFLVGFLLQTGAGDDIYRRVEDTEHYEADIPVLKRPER